MQEHFRNRYVIDRETGHPGYQATIVYATPQDLEELARKLGESARSAHAELTEYATVKHGPTSRVTLQFRAASTAQIELWHERPPLWRTVDWAVYALLGAVLALAIVGLYSLVT